MAPEPPSVELAEITPELHEACIALEVEAEQRRFVSPVADYLRLCDRPGSLWQPFVVLRHGEVVGFVMHGVDPVDDSAWIGGLVIDRAHQRRGIGRTVVELLIARATEHGRPSALSYEPGNAKARTLYAQAGFVETGETEDDEIVARRPL